MYEKIGILGAMEVEVENLISMIDNVVSTKIGMNEFFSGKINDKDVVVTRCGIGKVNSAVATQMMIDKFDVDCVINTGVAGAMHDELDVCDIVISTDLIQHDFDTSGAGDKKGVVCGFDFESFSADEHMISVCEEACKEVLEENKHHKGRIATGDQFIFDRDIKNNIKNDFTPHCVEMEGCAIAQTATINNKPFVVIRSISDKADDSATITYGEFVKIAADYSAKIVIKMLQTI